jgi:hypothetical protein
LQRDRFARLTLTLHARGYPLERIDPDNPHDCRKLLALIDLEADRLRYDVLLAEHQNSLALLLANVINRSVDDATVDNVVESIRDLKRNRFPWLADQLGAESTASGGQSREAAVAAYHAEYGYPGEERWEKMVAETSDAIERILAKNRARREAEEA